MNARLFLLVLLLLGARYGQGQGARPAVVVLGVNHSSQLVNPYQQPAVLRAFLDRVRPSAICIERDPEAFARQDFYEFTYEQQYCIVPYARAAKIPLFPIDWHPPEGDLQLAYGTTNLELPPFTRHPHGFWGFLSYNSAAALREPFYFADDTAVTNSYAAWYARYDTTQVHQDFARRLFLYRTFMQARRVEAASRALGGGDTLLVVVGAMHKVELELYLRRKGFTLLPASRYGPLPPTAVRAYEQPRDAYAILSFNLLGVQSRTRFMDTALVAGALQAVARDQHAEAAFFDILYRLRLQQISPRAAIPLLRALLQQVPEGSPFTWTGVQHRNRLDSYFDPFGNMSLPQRLRLELARAYAATGARQQHDQLKTALAGELEGLKRALLLAYWDEYVAPPAAGR